MPGSGLKDWREEWALKVNSMRRIYGNFEQDTINMLLRLRVLSQSANEYIKRSFKLEITRLPSR